MMRKQLLVFCLLTYLAICHQNLRTEEPASKLIREEEHQINAKPVKQLAVFPKKMLGGYACDGNFLTAQKIIDAGFNVVFAAFFDVAIVDGKMDLIRNRCCNADNIHNIANELISKGVIVIASIGGDGCQGYPPSGLDTLAPENILAGFENFRKRTGVDYHGIDFDWENTNAEIAPLTINHIGQALRPHGYFVTAVPMSSQFNPGALQGWKDLDPNSIDAVIPQWYQGGCVGTQSCPCWGPHPLEIKECPGFKQSYMQQARLCGINQWIKGFQQMGLFNFPPEKIVIGAKSWCGGDEAHPCSPSDTGIWGYEQISNIINTSGSLGVAIWDLNDYFNKAYFDAGNPSNEQCLWGNKVAAGIGIKDNDNVILSEKQKNEPAYCANYPGPLAQNCQPNPF